MKNNRILTVLNWTLFGLLLVVLSCRVGTSRAYAAGNWRGYAVYRDGVVLNVDDHAAIMDKKNISATRPVLHSGGYNGVVQRGTWEAFMGGSGSKNKYLGLYKPDNCYITQRTGDLIVAKARELLGTRYALLTQINYSAGSNTWVRPENILGLRCDGVVEYVYEWFGWKVGGSDSNWDISRNKAANFLQHSGFSITPRKQHEKLLKLVSSSLPN